MSSKKDSVFVTLPPITTGALTTAVAMYPADLVRALKMSSAAESNVGVVGLLRSFYQVHGAKGFVSQGVVPEMIRATYMRVLKFFLFPITHRALFGNNPSEGTAMTKVIAGGLCAMPEGFTIAPLEVGKIALQLDKENKFKNSTSRVMKHIVQTRGPAGLYMGYFGIQYRQVSWTAIYFASLKFWQDQSKAVIPADWKKSQQLTGGLAAGMFGAVFNTPGDVIRSAQQKKYLAEANPVKHNITPKLVADGVRAFFEMGSHIAKTQGVAALWAGFPFKAVHLGGSGALLAMLIPFFKGLMGVTQE